MLDKINSVAATEARGEWSVPHLLSAIDDAQRALFNPNDFPAAPLMWVIQRALNHQEGLFYQREVLNLPVDELQKFLDRPPAQRDPVVLEVYRLSTPLSNGICPVVVDEGAGGRGVVFFSLLDEAILFCLALMQPFAFLTTRLKSDAVEERREYFLVGGFWGHPNGTRPGLNVFASWAEFTGELRDSASEERFIELAERLPDFSVGQAEDIGGFRVTKVSGGEFTATKAGAESSSEGKVYPLYDLLQLLEGVWAKG